MFNIDWLTNVIIIDSNSHSEEDSNNDCFFSDGMDVLNAYKRSIGDHGPIQKEVSSESKEFKTSTTNVKTVEPESPIVICSNDCIFKFLSSKLII